MATHYTLDFFNNACMPWRLLNAWVQHYSISLNLNLYFNDFNILLMCVASKGFNILLM